MMKIEGDVSHDFSLVQPEFPPGPAGARIRNSRFTWLAVWVILCCVAATGCTEQETDQEVAARRLAAARKLNSLSYVATPKIREENRGLRGVVRYDPDLAYEGLNLYGSLTRRQAYLRRMTGEIVHTWNAEGVFSVQEEFPLGSRALAVIDDVQSGLLVAEIHGDHLLAIETMSGLVKLDWDSRVVFALPNNAHHDVDVDADGSILVLTAAPRWVETGRGSTIIIDDVIERVSPDGVLQQRYSVFELLAEDPDTRPLLVEKLRIARHWFDNMDQWRETQIANKPAARSDYEAIFQLYNEAFVEKTRTLEGGNALFTLLLTPADVLHSNSIEVIGGKKDGLWGAGSCGRGGPEKSAGNINRPFWPMGIC